MTLIFCYERMRRELANSSSSWISIRSLICYFFQGRWLFDANNPFVFVRATENRRKQPHLKTEKCEIKILKAINGAEKISRFLSFFSPRSAPFIREKVFQDQGQKTQIKGTYERQGDFCSSTLKKAPKLGRGYKG